jgi:hypothetical protein
MRNVTFLLLCLFCLQSFAQSPGQIVRPANGNGVTVLNPNGDPYSSATIAGFVNNDIASSEIPYKVVPPAITEPTGDIATGPAGGFTDIVKTVDNSGFYVYSDGTNILFRLRIGNIISGSKGYSILIDTDGKMGNSGAAADPNYIAPTNTSNGNPGFEYEVVLETNFRVAVYQVDGTASPGTAVATYALNSNAQISMALSTDGNNPDYFYDWYVPFTSIGSPGSFRLVATTVTSPSSALQGSRSDIYGIDDAAAGSVATAWTAVIAAQPPVTSISIGSGGSGINSLCTAAPVMNSPVSTGSNINVTGTWARMDASKPGTATITLYRNNIAAGTVVANSGAGWSIPVTIVLPGDLFYAKAVATGESQCLQSLTVIAGCTSLPAAPTITCASSKGITGIIPTGTTVSIYQVTSANTNPSTTLLSTGLLYTTNASDQTFNYYGSNPQSGNACQGQNGVLTTNATYMLVSNNGGCLSVPTFICITGASQNSWNYIGSNTLSVNTPVYPYQTTISGTGATSGQLLRLFVNNQYVSSVVAIGSSFSFSGLSLKAGDAVTINAQASGACMTQSSIQNVSCYTQPPVITTNSNGNLLSSANSIGGTTAWPNATITLYKGTAPTGSSAGTTVANSVGTWTVTGLTLIAGENYYATQTVNGCTSPASTASSVLSPTTVCPAFSIASYADNVGSISGSIPFFSGTIRLYLDGTLIGSAVVSNATAWSIPVGTNYANTLYAGGLLTVTAQAVTGAENTSCSNTAIITCTSPPQPTVSPLNSTIITGQNVSFSVSNAINNTWYSVRDNTGMSYATSTFSTGSGNVNLATLNFTSNGTYNLTILADQLSGCPASFRMASITVNASTLPVTFLGITAQYQNDLVDLSWTVTNEVNVDHYEVERSGDCNNFTTISSIPNRPSTSLNNQYTFRDQQLPFVNRWCYVIKQIDKDGRFTRSKVIAVQSINRELVWHLTPNPANSITTLIMQSPKELPATMLLSDINGKILYRGIVIIRKGNNSIGMPEISRYASGIYVLHLQTDLGNSSQKLIIK